MQIKIIKDALGKIYRGAGMVSGNGSSRLLLDYKYEHPQIYRGIMEHIFGEKGICVNHLKLEMGADINSSSGTEPCVKRYADEPADVTRGAGYILAADAKKINPDLTLDMLFWSEPKWVTDAEDTYAARYLWYTDTLRAAYRTYGLSFDYVSVSRNERDIDPAWILYFSRRIKTEQDLRGIKIVAADEENAWNIADIMADDPAVRGAVDVIGSHYTSVSTDNARMLSDKYGKELWFSEGCPPMTYPAALERFAGSPLTGANGVLDIAVRFAAMYPLGGMTLYEYQPVVSAYYDGVCFCHKQLIAANEPWSGHYTLDAGYFAAQFIAAFFKKGWRFVDSACFCDGEKDGHSLKNVRRCVMTAMSPSGDISLMIVDPLEEPLEYELPAGEMNVYELTRAAPFERAGRHSDGKLAVKPFSITILSTLDVQPPTCSETSSEVLSLPYSDNFAYSGQRNVPRYTTDQGGAFELRSAEGRQVLMQVITPDIKAMEWGATPEPTTSLGDDRWYNYSVTADCHLESSGSPESNYIGVGARYFLACAGMSGYSLRLYESGLWEFYRGSEAISRGSVPAAQDFTLGISCCYWEISAFIGGERVFTCREDLSGRSGIPAGRAALYSSMNRNYFRGISVSPLGECPYVTRFDDADGCFSYSGGWRHELMSSFADYRRTLSVGGAGCSFTFEFDGGSFGISGTAAPDTSADICLDGQCETRRLPPSESRELIISECGLADVHHVLTITVLSGEFCLDGSAVPTATSRRGSPAATSRHRIADKQKTLPRP